MTADVKQLVQAELNLNQMSDAASQNDHAEWDSLSYLRVLAALENRFGIEISSDNINNFNSIPNIVKEIEKQKNHR